MARGREIHSCVGALCSTTSVATHSSCSPLPIPWRTEGLTSGGIQPAVLQEVLPHLSTRSGGIECREVGDSRACLGKGRASSGAGSFEGQMQAPCPQQLWKPTLTPHMLPSNANSKPTHPLSCKLYP